MIGNKVYQDMINKVSKELGYKPEVIANAYRLYWECIADTFKNIDIESIKSEEDLCKYNTSFNIKGIGKFYTTFDKIEKTRKRIKIIKDIHNKNEKIN